MTSKARICVPICVQHADDLADAVKGAAALADVIEIRFDYFEPLEVFGALKEFASLRQAVAQPFILTFRPAEQGGFREISKAERIEFWKQVAQLPPQHANNWFDIEAELLLDAEELVNEVRGDRIICSHHDFKGVPEDLEQHYERITQTSAAITKIAVQANDATDCIPVFKLLERARREGRDLIAIAMGQAGLMTRILGASREGFLTFASLDAEKGSAPGQVTVRELRDLYRIDRINRDTEIFGVVGRPVSHSLSPHLHNASFASIDLNAVFIPFEVGDVVKFIRGMAHPKMRELDWKLGGLSVTAPHKSMVMQCLDWIDVAAREIGAVNTIVVQNDELHGYNTDAAGFVVPLHRVLAGLKDLRCAVIGAGGAARAAIWALKQEGADITVFAREKTKAEFLSKALGVKYQQLSQRGFAGYDLVVNATPLGTRGSHEHETIVTAEQLRAVRLAYDLVYNPVVTRFLTEARAAGCETIGGLEMLIAQAVEQFKLWTGEQPNVDVMRAAAERRLGIE
jgi:3-dehydroquinate dehydratase / shikimate dehydrogenase